MKLTPGDVVVVDLGFPVGHEAGLKRTAVIVTAASLIRSGGVVQVVPVTTTDRGFVVEVPVLADDVNGLLVDSTIQPQHIRSIATERITERLGNAGPAILAELREALDALLELPNA